MYIKHVLQRHMFCISNQKPWLIYTSHVCTALIKTEPIWFLHSNKSTETIQDFVK